jgi:mRNA interferase MazF
MKRGDVVTVAASGNRANRRATRATRIGHLCQMTSDIVDTPDFRVIIEPTETNGLRSRSQVMTDKPVTIRRSRVGKQIGSLDAGDLLRLNVALAFVMGLAD